MREHEKLLKEVAEMRTKEHIVLEKLTRADHEKLLDAVDDPAWFVTFKGWSDGRSAPKRLVVEKRHLEELYHQIGKALKKA